MALIAYIRFFIANIIFLVFGILIFSLFLYIAIILCPKKYRISFGDWVTQFWGTMTCFLMGIKVEVEGAENIRTGSVYLFSHKSQMDIPIIHRAIKTSLRFGSKKDFFHVPILGWAAKALGTLPIERSKPEEVIKVYEKSLPRIYEGMSFALSPEGGRHTGEGLRPFKSGPFIFTLSGNFPIVPVVIYGADKVLKKGNLFSSWGNKKLSHRVKVRILPAIETKDYNFESRLDLKKRVFELMSLAYKELSEDS